MSLHGFMIPFVPALLSALLSLPQTSGAQGISNQSVPPTFRDDRHHPDGFIGQLSFHGCLQYASVSKEDGHPFVDIQQYGLGVNLVASARLTLLTRLLAVREDSARYEFNGGFTYYLVDPRQTNRDKNPDGCIGGLALTAHGGVRYTTGPDAESRFVAGAGLILPVSVRMTLGTWYRHFEEMEEADVRQGYASITYYLSEYAGDSAYVNPDGPVGSLVIRASGGGSSKGVFGDLSLAFPLRGDLSLTVGVASEWVNNHSRRSHVARAGFSFYPGN